ncbi:tRNA (adenosine(37)-N6)-dimethylallyltransferase MiaA [Dyadobacter sp. Leaf189]|uniref:tRNA (adenosine(37)-N6)-dimethylallyltransferase MiaA n=1 Tax=Dyadobacter sp. Leaf189 TaxID=1736295 RepID=UPI0007016CE6|nr:tRNA (adenosine(37)-N6)-dimethylallyltransferase MiaA [Dyadobacter sp. Leaf189]KQS26608.1 tRNA dimethylallyltransferase [Dyadobacter sp. Leaf189]
MNIETPFPVILGPTASGKTRLAVQVARVLGGEIISADSRQIYRNMDIGTGKDLDEYVVEGQQIPYHLIDIAEAGAQYNVNDFQQDFSKAFKRINDTGHIPVVCGGTGFYIYALLKGHAYSAIPVNKPLRETLENMPQEDLLQRFNTYQTSYHELADTSTRKRLIRAIEISEFLVNNPQQNVSFERSALSEHAIIFGLNPPVEVRRQRITNRLHQRLNNGLIEEVADLLKILSPSQLIYYGLEYKYVTQYLTGELGLEEMKVKLETEIHRFAKRQMTFFRKMEKDGLPIVWLPDDWNESRKTEFITSRYLEFKESKRKSKTH